MRVRFFPALRGGTRDVLLADGTLCISVPLPFSVTPARFAAPQRPWHSPDGAAVPFEGLDGFGRSMGAAFSNHNLHMTGAAESAVFI